MASEKWVPAIERITLDEGAVVLQWPEELSAASVMELEYWINGVLRRAKRRAGLKQCNSTETRDEAQ